MTTFIETQKHLADHLRDPAHNAPPSDVEDRRLQIYRDLIFKNIEGFLSGGFPILRSLYCEQSWLMLVRDFIKGHRSHSPYFLEISQEFIRYLQEERGVQEGDPAFLLELAHYEWVELALDVSEEDIPRDDNGDILHTEDLLGESPVVSPLAWNLSYQYPVHHLGPEFRPDEPPEQPTFLIVYRNRHDQIQFMESNALTIRLLNLLEGEEALTGEKALRKLADEMQHPEPDALIQMGQNLLNKLQACDIIF
jgi:hypothetical protein